MITAVGLSNRRLIVTPSDGRGVEEGGAAGEEPRLVQDVEVREAHGGGAAVLERPLETTVHGHLLARGVDVDLAVAGASVTPLVVYRWGPPPDADAVTCGVEQAAVGDIDVVVFTSAPAAAAWLDAAQDVGVLPSIIGRARTHEEALDFWTPQVPGPMWVGHVAEITRQDWASTLS